MRRRRAFTTPSLRRPRNGRDDAIPYEIPARAELTARTESALQVVYLIFNEGYAAAQGPSLTRDDLCAEAIRLGRLVVELLDEPEAQGLLALMLLHEARRATRIDAAGDLILLENQNRSLWPSAQTPLVPQQRRFFTAYKIILTAGACSERRLIAGGGYGNATSGVDPPFDPTPTSFVSNESERTPRADDRDRRLHQRVQSFRARPIGVSKESSRGPMAGGNSQPDRASAMRNGNWRDGADSLRRFLPDAADWSAGHYHHRTERYLCAEPLRHRQG